MGKFHRSTLLVATAVSKKVLENEVKSCKTTQDRTRIREVAQEVAVDVTKTDPFFKVYLRYFVLRKNVLRFMYEKNENFIILY